MDLVSVEPGQCIEVDPNTSCSAFMDVAGKGPKLLSLPYDRNPLLLFRFRQGNIPADADGKLRCNCSIKLLSKKASKIYSKKETETFIMEWDVENIAAIHEHLAQEINLTQVEMRKELETLMRFEAFVKLGKSICGITKPIEITGAALSVTGNILQIPPPTKAAGKALVESGEKTGVFGENLFGGKNGIFKQFCSFFTCKRNNPITNAINPDKLFPGGETMAKWAGYDNVSMAMNPHRSIVWSVVYLCAPGFVDSMKRKQATDCHYVHCLQSMANSGFSPASCSNMRSYMHCRYFTGEIFQAVPYSALLGNIVGKVRTALSNPVGLVFSALSVSCSTIKVFPGKGVCNILAETSKIGNLVRQGKEIYTSIVEFDMGGIVGKSSTNAEEYCDEIRGEFPPLTPPQLDRQYNSPFAGREIVLDNNEKYNCDYITCRTGNIYTVRTSSTESETFVMHPDGYLVNFNQHFAANYQNAQIDFNKAQIDYNKFMTDFPNEDKWDEYVQDSMSPYWSDDFRWQTGTPGWIIEAADTLYDEKLAQMNEPFENAQANLNDMQKVIQNADINGLSVDDINNLKAPDEIAATIQSKQNTIKTDGETAQSKFMTSLSTTLLKNIENQANRNAMQTLIDTIETTQSEWNTARKRWAQGQAELSRLQSELSGCQDDACRNRLRGLIDTKENEVNGEDGLRAVANKAEDAYVAAVNDASSEHKFNQVWRNPESAVIVGTILNNGVIGAEIGNLLGGGFDNVMISEIDEFFQEGWGKWFTEDGFAEEICKRGKTDQKPVANVPLINMDGYMMSAIHVEGQVTEKQDANQNIIYDYFASLEVSMKKAGLDWEVLLKADGKPDLSMEMNESLLTTIQRTPLTSSVLYINSTSKYSKVCFKAHEDIAPYFDEFEETVYPLVDWQQGRPNSEFCVPLTTYAFD